MSEPNAPSRAQSYAELIAQAAQAAAAAVDQNNATAGKAWWKSKSILGATLASVGGTILPAVLIASHASPATSQAVTMAVVVGGSLLSAIGRMTAKHKLH